MVEAEKANEELASIVRVRNRLASTDDTRLPGILKNLLPRLLSKIDTNSNAAYSREHPDESMDGDEENVAEDGATSVYREIQENLVATCSHAVDRLKANRYMSVPWVPLVATLVTELESFISITLALSLLEQGIWRSPIPVTEDLVLPSLIRVVEKLHRDLGREATNAPRRQFENAGWLLLDALFVVSHVDVHLDWDREHYKPVSWSVLQENVPSPSEATHQLFQETACQSLLELTLDVLLFRPPRNRTWRLREDDNQTGISMVGLSRMKARSHGGVWNETHLLQLKFVCLQYFAAFSVAGPTIKDQVLLVAVLMEDSSMHGRLATSILQRIGGAESMDADTNDDAYCCSVQLACCLLILVLGDEAAAPVLAEYKDQCSIWEGTLGARPETSPMRRSELPHAFANRALTFIRHYFVPGISSVASSLAGEGIAVLSLFVDLVGVLPISETNDFGILVLYELFKQNLSNQMDNQQARAESWKLHFHRQCLNRSLSLLSVLPGENDVPLRVLPRLPEDMEPGHRDFGARADITRLVDGHRHSQKRLRLQSHEALVARDAALELMGGIYDGITGAGGLEDVDVDVAASLIKCVMSECERRKQKALTALKILLGYFVHKIPKENKGNSFRIQVMKLIPSLLLAACDGHLQTKQAALTWCRDLVSRIDPEVATFICRYLTGDRETSELSKETVKFLVDRYPYLSTDEPGRPDAVVQFFDTTLPVDRFCVEHDLDTKVREVAAAAECPQALALAALLDHRFRKDEALNDIVVLKRPSLLQPDHTDEGVLPESSAFDCQICYDSCRKDDSYALSCKHSFCLPCWQDYIDNTLNESVGGVLPHLQCPLSSCGQPVLAEDIKAMRPDRFPEWESLRLQTFINHSSCYRACPGTDCGMTAYLPFSGPNPITITGHCTACKSTFCFGCRQDSHLPAQCEDFERWNRIFGSTEFWIQRNSKPCPSCKVQIEKNDGCNHMTCSQCAAEFCWLCLSPMQYYAERHICNQYDPTNSAENEDQRRSLFYTDRWKAQKDEAAFAQRFLDSIENIEHKLLIKCPFLSDDDLDVLRHGRQVTVKMHTFLMNSYIRAWAITDNDEERESYEAHQAALVVVTHRLELLLARDIAPLYTQGARNAVRQHLRSIAFFSAALEGFSKRLLPSYDNLSSSTSKRNHLAEDSKMKLEVSLAE